MDIVQTWKIWLKLIFLVHFWFEKIWITLKKKVQFHSHEFIYTKGVGTDYGCELFVQKTNIYGRRIIIFICVSDMMAIFFVSNVAFDIAERTEYTSSTVCKCSFKRTISCCSSRLKNTCESNERNFEFYSFGIEFVMGK